MAIVDEYGLDPVRIHRVAGLANIQTPHVVNSSEIIGIEVEVENYQVRDALVDLNRAWRLTEDGSLRNNGVELVSKPIPASAAPVCLEYLMNSFLSQECCFSPRTSVHIHLNIQDLTRPQAMDMILLYTVFERLFYQYAGRGRQKNIFCVPLTECSILTNLVDYGETRDRRWLKYTGLNTLPIQSYGTIEFRHMHGTTDVGKLSAWISMICKLKEYIRRTSTKDIRVMIAQMNDAFDFGQLLNDIFGDYARLFQYRGPQELTYMHAKHALIPNAEARNIRHNSTKDSSFFKFKG